MMYFLQEKEYDKKRRRKHCFFMLRQNVMILQAKGRIFSGKMEEKSDKLYGFGYLLQGGLLCAAS